MPTTHRYDVSVALDAEDDDALELIEKYRSRGKLAAFSLLGALLFALLGATYAMYGASEQPAYRTGTSR
jgi:hypothetical protein